MKLFISYSRDDKAWVYELWRQIRDELHHDTWIDRRIVPASDWWGSILENIEQAECFIYVMSPKAVESIYCQAELDYAIALNKPILPLLLKSCDIPMAINYNRIQYQLINDDMSMDKVLLRITQGLMSIQQGHYDPKEASRPDVPTPKQNPEHIFEVFALAEEAVAEDNITLAQQFYGQVIESDPDGLGMAAKERMDEIMIEHDRATAYANVKRLAENPVTLPGAQAAWRAFQRTYGDYNPDNLQLDDKKRTKPKSSDLTQQAIERARQFRGKHNRDWQPYITTFSDSPIPDMLFCLVPVGSFNMGSDDVHSDDETPVHLQIITEPYWLAQYSVTNAQWKQAVDAGVVKEPSGNSAMKWYTDSKMADAPVVGVDWFMAHKFTQWLGGRLPSELEWEYGARGIESWRYPWGDDWNPDLPIWGENSEGKPALVTSKVDGKSWIGTYHLSGNVWEWTNSLFKDYPYEMNDGREVNTGNETEILRVLRGGSWGINDSDYLRSACRLKYNPYSRNYNRGLRLFRSLK